MAKKRGFFAELQHQTQVTQKRNHQAATAAYRVQVAAARRAEQIQNQAERAHAAAMKSSAADKKAAEKEAQRLHEESMQADVDLRNATLAATYDDIDSMLDATLAVDDYVDIEKLRPVVEHPPFSRSDLEWPTPQPGVTPTRAEPVFVEPQAPSAIGGLLGGRRKHADLVENARDSYAADHAAWEAEQADVRSRRQQEYARSEQERLARLQAARTQYETECRQREAQVADANRQLDLLIQGLAYGVEEAIQEYVSIVLGNSVYPDSFPVSHDFHFNPALKELALSVAVPAPSDVPSVKEYKYVRAKDAIAETQLTQKEQKDRYASALCQVALRTLHEVFEADRAARIQTIALSVATETIDAATGQMMSVPLVAVAADRSTFTTFDLARVVPSATLQHLGALVSKNPFGLVPVDTSQGVRGR